MDGSAFEAERGTPEAIRAVGERLAAAGAVETWWHPQGMCFVRAALPNLDEYGNLTLLNPDETASTDMFDWTHDVDKAGRHLVHVDGLGVTFMTFDGQPLRTHRVSAAVLSSDQIQYRNGYTAQLEWLAGLTVTQAEHVLAERELVGYHGTAYNRGATDATKAYIEGRA